MNISETIGIISGILGIISFFLLEGNKKILVVIFFLVLAVAFYSGSIYEKTKNTPKRGEPKPRTDKFSHLIGKVYRNTYEIFETKVEDRMSAVLCSSTNKSDFCIATVRVFEKSKFYDVLILEKIIDRAQSGKVNYKILDVFTFKQFDESQFVSDEICSYFNGVHSDCSRVVACLIPKQGIYDSGFLNFKNGSVSQACVVDSEVQKIIPIDESQVECEIDLHED